jgi:hypothetical protein
MGRTSAHARGRLRGPLLGVGGLLGGGWLATHL